jgi:hypothetical protein
VGTVKRVAPIVPVRDLSAAAAHYERLGFAIRAYEGGGYAFATRDGVEIHLGVVTEPFTKSSAYLLVDDVDGARRRVAGCRRRGPSARRHGTGGSTREPSWTPTAT